MKKKWFTWHRWPEPKDKRIESVYEIVFLALVFVLFLFIYIKMNQVNVVREELDVACVDRDCFYEDQDSTDAFGRHPVRKKITSTAATVSYVLPMTDSDYLRNNAYKLYNDSISSLIIKFECRDDIQQEEKWKNDIISITHAKANYDSVLYTTHFAPSDTLCKPLFYMRHLSQYRGNAITLPHFNDTEWDLDKFTIEEGYNNTLIGSRFTWPFSLQKDYFVSGSLHQLGEKHVFARHEIPIENYTNWGLFKVHNYLGDPGWLSLEDVSQAYFELNLQKRNIDSLTLCIDFVGATQFSIMTPTPDKITMSRIVFTDQSKIDTIRTSGLRFHAQFKELENRQNVRMFFLTSVMAALVTIFIVFIVIGTYKVFILKNDSEQKTG